MIAFEVAASLFWGVVIIAIIVCAVYDKLRPKCCVCKKRQRGIPVAKIYDGITGMGGYVRIPHHISCFDDVLLNPNNYDDDHLEIFNINSVASEMMSIQESEACIPRYYSDQPRIEFDRSYARALGNRLRSKATQKLQDLVGGIAGQ